MVIPTRKLLSRCHSDLYQRKGFLVFFFSSVLLMMLDSQTYMVFMYMVVLIMSHKLVL